MRYSFLNCLQKRSVDEWLPVKQLSSTNITITILSGTKVQPISLRTSIHIITIMSMTMITTICTNTVTETDCEQQEQRRSP
jgi:hypothetical protein